jgi:hypothetical protein
MRRQATLSHFGVEWKGARPSFRLWKETDDFELVGKPTGLGFREDQVAVGQDVELALASRRGLGLEARLVVNGGRETRGPSVVAASGGAVEDLDGHESQSTTPRIPGARLEAACQGREVS